MTLEPTAQLVTGNPVSTLAKRLAQIHQLQNEWTSSSSSHDMIELALATATSLDICLADETPPLWPINAGEAGSDKTQSIDSLRGAAMFIPISYIGLRKFLSRHSEEFPPIFGKAGENHHRVRLLTGRELREIRQRVLMGPIASKYVVEFFS